jgi:Tol biopolymer transport system component/predicted Ser/Thr protein kinase
MTPERWRQIEEFYHLARERGTAALSDADPDLRGQVERLLAQDLGGKILDRPAAELFPEPEKVGVGTRIGPYLIEGILGAGGMGEVYLAQDNRLKRRVALKVLPKAFIHDPERLARFQREAEVLAHLNHPNIAQIYGAEESALVMEFVEGVVPQGPLPFDEAWKIALQIAHALEYAHERGVIHRDLKPANVKVTPDGVVKLLDFGLAKAFGEPSGMTSPDAGNSPVPLPGETTDGMILGTAAYMSPEQAKGKRLDKRTDIWSWGVLFYELLTGEQLFRSENFSETIVQVLTKDPEFGRVPPKARKLIQSCLEKDPKKRLRDIGDGSRLLDEPPAARSGVPSRVIPVWAAALAVVLAVMTVIGIVLFTRTPQSAPALRYNIALENATSIQSFAISPDGHYLAMAAEVNGKSQLWLRALDSLRVQPLPNTDDAKSPFWSPDSREIGFFAQGQLKKIAVTGGAAISLCDAPDGFSGSWSRDNVILFSRDVEGAAIQRVSASVGVPNDVIKGKDLSRYPTFLPDGRRFLYHINAAAPSERGIYLAALDGKESHRILAEDSSFVLTPGWLLFVRANTLIAQPFDAAAGRVVGGPIPLVESVSYSTTTKYARITSSQNGVLLYEANRASGRMQMAWSDRSGKLLGTVGSPATVFDPAISPDEKRIVFRQVPSSSLADLWLWDVNRGTGQRITTDPSINGGPHWSPDGDRIVFSSNRGNGDIYIKAAGGTGEDQLLLTTAHLKFVSDWSRDGRFIVYSETDPKTRQDIWVLPMEGMTAGKPIRFLGSEFNEALGQLSADDHWMAYTSDESGQREVYVRPFPSGDGQWKISIGGGDQSRWRADGRELYFVRADGMMMAVPVKAALGPKLMFEPGTPQPLFETHLAQTGRGGVFEYDVTPDGKRFLLDSTVEGSTAAPLTVVVNWAAGLKR